MGLNKRLRSVEYQQQQFAELVEEDLRRMLEKINQKKAGEVKDESKISEDLPKQGYVS